MQQSISQKIITQRYYSLFLNSVGEMLTIDLISGDTIKGILDTIDPFNNEFLIINNPRRLSRTNVPIFLKENKLKVLFRDIRTISYEINNTLPSKEEIPNVNNNSHLNIFETDSQILKRNAKNEERKEVKLVKYEINEKENNMFAFQSLEDDENSNNNEKLDQFEINKKKFNIVSTYDENLYTTKLDKNKITKEQQDYADKIYNEIKNSSNNEKNIHILEDRGIIYEKDEDEEEKYSSVIKNDNNSNDNLKIRKMNISNFFDDNNINININSNNFNNDKI